MISKFRDIVPPVYIQNFNVSALYLDHTATIHLRSDQMVEIFPPLHFLLVVSTLIGWSRSSL
jgi:hypothetical protein